MRNAWNWTACLAVALLAAGCGDQPKSQAKTQPNNTPAPGQGTEKSAVAARSGDASKRTTEENKTPGVAPAKPAASVTADGAVMTRGPRPAPSKRAKVVALNTPLKLAFVCNNASNFWLIAQKGIQKAEKEFELNVTFLQPPKGTVEEQNQYLEDLVRQGFHGIAISPIAPEGQREALDRAAAKTNLITQDSDAAGTKRLAYIGTNNFEAGKALGAEIVRLLPKGGKIAVFVGMFSADNARQRLAGIEEAVKGKNIEIVAKKEDGKDTPKALANVEDVLNSMPDVNLLAGLWSYNAPAIATALRAKKGTKVIGVGFDEDLPTLSAIEAGVLDCTVVQKPFEFGYQSIKLLREIATKGDEAIPIGGVIDTGIEVISKKNVAEFKASLPK